MTAGRTQPLWRSLICLRIGLGVLVAGIAVSVPAAGAADALTPVRIAADTLTGDGQHATVVEPHSAAFGSTIVAVFQVARRETGGAAAIGFATSTDAARTWQAGLVPKGPSAFSTDPVVAFDAAHSRWLVAFLGPSAGKGTIQVSGSADGLSWTTPGIAGVAPSADKEWIVCDNGAASPFRGRCYVAYASWENPGFGGPVSVAVLTTTDGGSTWSGPAKIPVEYDGNVDTLSPQPVVRPNGELVIVFFEQNVVRAIRSTDGGASFAARETVAALSQRAYSFARDRFRGTPTPTVDVDAEGTIYAAWYDCRFRWGCAANDIVLAKSSASGTWTGPQRIPLVAADSAADVVIPALAVGPASRGATARLALAYYTLTATDCVGTDCRVQAGLATSSTGGDQWQVHSIAAEPMPLEWLAPTAIGRMLGDYVGMSVVGDRAVAVIAIARPPQDGRFDVAVYAVSAPLVKPPPPKRCTVPAVVGKTLTAAKRVLTAAHCTLGKVTRAYSARVKSGRVLSQSPAVRTVRRAAAPVNVVLSRGPRPRRA